MKKNLKTNTYTNYPLFKGVNQNSINVIMNCFKSVEKEYKKGTYIWHAGDEASYVGIVVKGQVNIVKDDISGDRVIINTAYNPMIFGESYAIAKISEYPVSVQAAVDSKIILIDIDKLMIPCSVGCSFHNKVIKNLVEIIAKKNIKLNGRIECITKKTIKQKLVFYLIDEMKMNEKDEIQIPYNRNELSDYLNVNRSALSRVLSKLEEDGVLIFNKNKFRILDYNKIKEIMEN